ncbi:MAG TPA: response regulator transcription factor [Nitrospiria bacterium]
MGKKVLVIEDDKDIANLVVHYLEKEGFRVTVNGNGISGLKQLSKETPDLLILDLMLPEMDGLEICRQARANPRTSAVAILMLTAKGEETDRIVGLEVGADDYLTKPFSPKELVARVRALLRRVERQETAEGPYHYGDLLLDSARHEVQVHGKEVTLTAKEFKLLEELLREKGRVLSRDSLLDRVWGYEADVMSRTVDVHIRRLREKIPFLQDAIQTVKPFGYKLKEAL